MWAWLKDLDWVQISWQVIIVAGMYLWYWYGIHGDSTHFDDGTMPP